MLRTLGTCNKCLDFNFVPSYISYQSLRWRRKPRWLPVAPSKIFRVPERTQVSEEDKVELRRLHNNYRTQTRAIRCYLFEEIAKTTSSSEVAQLEAKAEDEEHNRCMKENETWNAQIALLRDARLIAQSADAKENILNRIIAREQLEKEQLEKVEQIVREEKMKAQTFITADNIDKAIEEALANPVDPNFAIDLEGNIYHGRYTRPEKIPEKEKKIQASSS